MIMLILTVSLLCCLALDSVCQPSSLPPADVSLRTMPVPTPPAVATRVALEKEISQGLLKAKLTAK